MKTLHRYTLGAALAAAILAPASAEILDDVGGPKTLTIDPQVGPEHVIECHIADLEVYRNGNLARGAIGCADGIAGSLALEVVPDALGGGPIIEVRARGRFRPMARPAGINLVILERGSRPDFILETDSIRRTCIAGARPGPRQVLGLEPPFDILVSTAVRSALVGLSYQVWCDYIYYDASRGEPLVGATITGTAECHPDGCPGVEEVANEPWEWAVKCYILTTDLPDFVCEDGAGAGTATGHSDGVPVGKPPFFEGQDPYAPFSVRLTSRP